MLSVSQYLCFLESRAHRLRPGLIQSALVLAGVDGE